MVILYRLYQLFIAAPVLLLITLVASIATIVGCTVASPAFWSYWPARIWSRCICTILLLRVEVHGRENMQKGVSYVIVPNHQGAFDIFLVYGYLNRHFKWMMKKSLRGIPLIGKACEQAGHVFVDKSGPKATARTMQQARKVLRRGISIVAFPEGERTRTGKMNVFRRGPFALADEIKLPVLPLVIQGSYDVLPRHRGVNFVTFHKLTLTILPPIATEGRTIDEVRDESYNAIKEVLGE